MGSMHPSGAQRWRTSPVRFGGWVGVVVVLTVPLLLACGLVGVVQIFTVPDDQDRDWLHAR
jgi:hypothetical protein